MFKDLKTDLGKIHFLLKINPILILLNIIDNQNILQIGKGITSPQYTNIIIHNFEAAKLIEMIPRDKRSFNIKLTDKGKKLREHLKMILIHLLTEGNDTGTTKPVS